MQQKTFPSIANVQNKNVFLVDNEARRRKTITIKKQQQQKKVLSEKAKRQLHGGRKGNVFEH
jgi:hypothetical protein